MGQYPDVALGQNPTVANTVTSLHLSPRFLGRFASHLACHVAVSWRGLSIRSDPEGAFYRRRLTLAGFRAPRFRHPGGRCKGLDDGPVAGVAADHHSWSSRIHHTSVTRSLRLLTAWGRW